MVDEMVVCDVWFGCFVEHKDDLISLVSFFQGKG